MVLHSRVIKLNQNCLRVCNMNNQLAVCDFGNILWLVPLDLVTCAVLEVKSSDVWNVSSICASFRVLSPQRPQQFFYLKDRFRLDSTKSSLEEWWRLQSLQVGN